MLLVPVLLLLVHDAVGRTVLVVITAAVDWAAVYWAISIGRTTVVGLDVVGATVTLVGNADVAAASADVAVEDLPLLLQLHLLTELLLLIVLQVLIVTGV